ncbi:heme biosynthesis HemY N-terminal domain-containing protein [Derxia gummosa]|uniref:Heme biosynthesis HemY N-terminal domain-containing protein n=1 Tax=Derxia gummosa DSM 723 TaxID=1121388 RepID=A0A8B6X972_9BURK|nr:heme biosynthesis HemY N-terminal domain-containing protein [Derxia gummosa]
MKGLFWFVILVAAGIGVGLLARLNNGNVVLLLPPWRVDVSLNLFVMALLGLFALFYALMRLVLNTLELPASVAAFRKRQREQAALDGLKGALQAYFEGRFARAERSAMLAQEVPGYGGIAALVAARASQKMREFTRRDGWIERAATDPSVRTARLMTEVELLLEERRADEARELLGQLHASGARHVASLRLALQAAQQVDDWEEVLRLVRQLTKRDAIHPTVAAKTKATAYSALLARRGGDLAGLRNFWMSVPTDDQSIVEVAGPVARAVAALGDHRLAVQIVETALENRWDDRLLLAYAEVGSREGRLEQIQRAEAWLSTHPQDSTLFFALGKLCELEGLWGKAADYLERSLRLEKRVDALYAIGNVIAHAGDRDKACEIFRECASFAASQASESKLTQRV